ncbi:hypothetical protein N7508_004961 [Penicillium antarcticum]|uniref:uncharacterized protein n=1 Tax=Penicillium antarcticum TaxID=416450 RepID=UPI0023935663|nr:uncharacterized protein N7508_004961 [Penicillium antarcticum]KAJ5305946.1 hypothetical protein N7508_004961 [Penicillium antarcticum]
MLSVPAKVCGLIRLTLTGPVWPIIEPMVSLHGALVLLYVLMIRREINDVNMMNLWVISVGKILREAGCALSLSLLVAEGGQISRKRLHEGLLAAKVLLDATQVFQRSNNLILNLSVLVYPSTLILDWGLASQDLFLVGSEHALANAAGLVHLALDGAWGGTASVELSDQVEVQLLFVTVSTCSQLVKMPPFYWKCRLT